MFARVACIQDPVLITIMIAANGLVWLSYLSLSWDIAWLMLRARKVPYPVVWALFGGFILSCGGTHFCAALVFFKPAYYLEAGVLTFTALISSSTAILFHRWRRAILESLRDWLKLRHVLEDATERESQ